MSRPFSGDRSGLAMSVMGQQRSSTLLNARSASPSIAEIHTPLLDFGLVPEADFADDLNQTRKPALPF
jgi:hypothetical protein